ncbi:MAG: lysophospholipid acyltransferase family protein [Dehalococcoidia bacterium]
MGRTMPRMEGAEPGESQPEEADRPATPIRGPVVSLREAWERRRVLRREWRFPTWPRRWPIRWSRRAIQTVLIFPLLRAGYSLEINGRANIDRSREPYLVISNHNMHLDQGMLLRAMPADFRQRVAIAAAASDIYGNRVRGFFASLLGNAFPFAKEGAGIRESLEYVFKMLDDRWNVLMFPEGKLTVLGPMQRFKTGIGRLAVDAGVPVLPMRIDVIRPGFYEGRWLPHPRARILVTIGKPVICAPGTSPAQAAALLERAVREA